MKRETIEYLVEAWELASYPLTSTERDRLRYCLSQVIIDLMADDGGDDA